MPILLLGKNAVVYAPICPINSVIPIMQFTNYFIYFLLIKLTTVIT